MSVVFCPAKAQYEKARAKEGWKLFGEPTGDCSKFKCLKACRESCPAYNYYAEVIASGY